jgi:hypothetical protein
MVAGAAEAISAGGVVWRASAIVLGANSLTPS